MTDAPPPPHQPGDDRPSTPDAPTEPAAAAPSPADPAAGPVGSPVGGPDAAATPDPGWPEPRGGRWRRWRGRVRGSRAALVVAGLVVAAGLVLGGVALGSSGGEHRGPGRGGQAVGPQDGGDRGDQGGRGERGARGDGPFRNGNGNAGGGNRAGNGDNVRGPGAGGNRQGGGTGQQVLGVVTAVSTSNITVRTSGGTPSYAISTTTPVSRNGAAAGVTDIKVGDAVVIRLGSTSAGSTPVVERIAVG